MPLPRLIDGLSQIAAQYDVLLCDVWGVIHDGRAPFEEAAEALRQFRRRHGKVALVSNAPRLAPLLEEQFRKIGVATDFYDAIVTSGGATRQDLIRRGPLSLYYMGPEHDLSLLEGLFIERTGLEQADIALCVGLKDDLTETPADYSGVLAQMRARKLPMLCANPDLRVYRGQRLCWCAGALASAYEELGGRVAYFGKPHPAIYRAALAAVGGAGNQLAIGDALVTDLKGAGQAGLDALFIADGLHGEEIEPYTASHLGDLFAAHHVAATAAMRVLRW